LQRNHVKFSTSHCLVKLEMIVAHVLLLSC